MKMSNEFEFEVFGLKCRIQNDGKYQKSDGTFGDKKKGITLSEGANYMRLNPLQLAGLITAFAPGTDERKELAERVAEYKKTMQEVKL